MPKGNTTKERERYQVTVYLDRALDRALEQVAVRRDITKSDLVKWALLRVPEIRGEMEEILK